MRIRARDVIIVCPDRAIIEVARALTAVKKMPESQFEPQVAALPLTEVM